MRQGSHPLSQAGEASLILSDISTRLACSRYVLVTRNLQSKADCQSPAGSDLRIKLWVSWLRKVLMSINQARFNSPATKGEVAIATLHARQLAIMVQSLMIANKWEPGRNASFDAVQKLIDEMKNQFDELVGWQDVG